MKTLAKFADFYCKLVSNPSRTFKINVLTEYKEDEDIKHYLKFLLNPYIVTGISDKKIQKLKGFVLDRLIVTEDSTVFDMLDYISIYNTGADNYLETMKDFSDRRLVDEFRELFYKIISKNLPLTVDAKTVNKVIPNLVPTFNVMLANKYFDNPKIVEGKRFVLTTKIDGGRIIAIKKNGEAKFYTRQGQEYEGLVDLKEEMERYMPDNVCLDGEITLLNPYVESTISDFVSECLLECESAPRICTCTKLSSKDQYKETMKITRKDGEKHGVKMLVFDCMTADEFENQKCDRPYSNRRLMLYDIITSADVKKDAELRLQGSFLRGCDKFPQYFELLPVLYDGEDTSIISEILNEQITEGEEGVMINIWDAPYDFKRTNNLLKVKKMNDIDLEVIGFEEGTNRHTGRLGALLVEYKGNTVKVGSGFSDELRTEIWEHKEDWLGRTIVVQYFEETTNDNGGTSLRFPVYLDYRTDK